MFIYVSEYKKGSAGYVSLLQTSTFEIRPLNPGTNQCQYANPNMAYITDGPLTKKICAFYVWISRAWWITRIPEKFLIHSDGLNRALINACTAIHTFFLVNHSDIIHCYSLCWTHIHTRTASRTFISVYLCCHIFPFLCNDKLKTRVHLLQSGISYGIFEILITLKCLTSKAKDAAQPSSPGNRSDPNHRRRCSPPFPYLLNT